MGFDENTLNDKSALIVVVIIARYNISCIVYVLSSIHPTKIGLVAVLNTINVVKRL